MNNTRGEVPKMRFDKLALAGIALFAFVPLSAVPTSAQPLGLMGSQPQRQSHEKTLSAPTGRFVFGQISESGKDKFMLDTHTGRLWRISETGKIGIFLESVPYKTSGGEYTPFPDDTAKSQPPQTEKK
jgi:hypothetical protein